MVPSWLQILDSVSSLLDKADAYCAKQQLAPMTLIDTRLAPDMYPLGYQVKGIPPLKAALFDERYSCRS
ncbi:DUF1993 family protein [Bradyrhizobium sp. 61]|nr:DUF1993 family protein [Bradyrhizobium sp. 61]MCK1446662.1 DUF1993 family protein [Bradyrhizobium sp. 48]MCK1465646.1 DUF1993 family protein [Bradyrhizobium sp. 2]